MIDWDLLYLLGNPIFIAEGIVNYRELRFPQKETNVREANNWSVSNSRDATQS